MTPPRLTHPARAAFAACALLMAAAQSPAQETVWILNSDRSVEKYRTAEDAFKDAWKAPTMDIDLGRLTLDREEVERRAKRTPPAAVYCVGSKAYLVADHLLQSNLLVVSSALNWQRLPRRENWLVIANEVPADGQLTLFRHFFPQVRRIGVLGSRIFSGDWIDGVVAAGSDLGFEIHHRFVEKPADVSAALAYLLPRIDAFWLTADPVVLTWGDASRQLLEQTRAAGKPVFAFSSAFAELGAVLSIGSDDATSGRQAAARLEPLKSGVAPPRAVWNPAGSRITLNLRAVHEHRLELNEAALGSVNDVIR